MEKTKNNFLSRFKKFVECIGIDEIPYAIGICEFKDKPPFQPTKLNDIKEKISELNEEKIDDALKYCKDILTSENKRGDKIENKAFNLLSVSGISATFITGITSIISSNMEPWFLYLILVILVILSLTLTILLAYKVVEVGKFKFGYPDISIVFTMGSKDIEQTKKEQLAFYLDCYKINFQTHNIKASYLIGSQIWFRNAIILLLILGVALAFNTSRDSNSIPSKETSQSLHTTVSPTINFTSTEIPVIIINPQEIIPSITPTFVAPINTGFMPIISTVATAQFDQNKSKTPNPP